MIDILTKPFHQTPRKKKTLSIKKGFKSYNIILWVAKSVYYYIYKL